MAGGISVRDVDVSICKPRSRELVEPFAFDNKSNLDLSYTIEQA
jgi:hypothetical protein